MKKVALAQATAWQKCQKRLLDELSETERARFAYIYTVKDLTASLERLKLHRESLRKAVNWDRLSSIVSLLMPVAEAVDVLAEGLCIPSKTLWLSLSLVVEAVSASGRYLDYVLRLFEYLLQELPRVEAYSEQMLRKSPTLRAALSDVFELHVSLTARCLKTFGRGPNPGLLARIRWIFDKYNFEHDLWRLNSLIDRVKAEVGHLSRTESTARSEADLHTRVNEVCKIIDTLGNNAADPTSRPAHHAKRFSTVPWARNRFFTGRESILADIHSHLAPDGKTVDSHQRAVAICGLGGIGKTQIALEYAHLHKDDYKACFWVTCDANVKILSAFSEMARVLNFADVGSEQNLANVMDWLKTTTDPWLLIFDNAEEPQSLVPFWPPSRHGCVLLTSQDTSWKTQETISLKIDLSSLGADDGVKLLESIFSRDKRTISHKAAKAIVHETGGLPLALRQIASFIVSRDMDPEEFILRYRELRSSTSWVDKWNENTQQSYSHTLATFLDFSINKLSQPARPVLGAFCFLDVDNVWANLLSGLSSGSLDHADNAVHDENVVALCRHSLIYKVRIGEEVVFSIHRQVKRHLFDRLDEAQLAQGLQWITVRLRYLFPRQVPWKADLSDKNEGCARYIPHVLGLSDALPRTSHLAQDPTMVAQLLLDGGIYLWSKRLLEDAKALLDKSLIMWEMRGKDKVLLAEIYTIRASVLADSGNFVEALAEFRRVISALNEHKALGKGSRGEYDDVYLANAYNNLGAMYMQLDDFEQAKTFIDMSLRKKVTLQRRNVPMSHLLCVSYQNLATIYARLGDPDQASQYFRKALDAGDVEHSTLRMALIYHNYGALMLEMSKLPEALELLEKAYQLRVDNLGDSQDTAATIHLLACCHHKSHEEASNRAAKELLVDAVRILRQRSSQIYKTRLARSLFKLSLVLDDMGDAEAAQHRDEACTLWMEVKGESVQVPKTEEAWDACLPYV